MKIRQLFIVMCCFVLMGCSKPHRAQYQGYVEGENLYLASPYSGTLTQKRVQRGQTVKRGELLFQLDSNPQILLISQADAELLQAKKIYTDLVNPRRPPEIAAIQAQIEQTNAQIRLAALRVKRMRELYTKNATDKDSVDNAEAHYDQLVQSKTQYQENLKLALMGAREEQLNAQQAQVNALIAKLSQAKWQLSQKSIYAPHDGIIFDTYFLQGEFVPSQRAIASLLTPQTVRIQFFVPAADLSHLRLGQKITFECEGCAQQNQATIQYISSEAEYIPPLIYSEANIDKLIFRVKASIKKAMSFKPGQPVIVTVNDNGT